MSNRPTIPILHELTSQGYLIGAGNVVRGGGLTALLPESTCLFLEVVIYPEVDQEPVSASSWDLQVLDIKLGLGKEEEAHSPAVFLSQ